MLVSSLLAPSLRLPLLLQKLKPKLLHLPLLPLLHLPPLKLLLLLLPPPLHLPPLKLLLLLLLPLLLHLLLLR